MSEVKETVDKKYSTHGIGSFIFGLMFAAALLYVGGWSVIWAESMYTTKAFVINGHGFAVQFNELYYGAEITSRFFDSQAISWFSLILAFGITPVGFFLFSGDD